MLKILRLIVADLLLCVLSSAFAQNVIPLSQSTWTLSNPNLDISVPAKFPSQAHLDLYDQQVIGDPYYGLNDFNLRWVAEVNWTYSAPLPNLCVFGFLLVLFHACAVLIDCVVRRAPIQHGCYSKV